jgi:hypothetical protein
MKLEHNAVHGVEQAANLALRFRHQTIPMPMLRLHLIVAALLSATALTAAVNPHPPQVLGAEQLYEWTFDTDAGGWGGPQNCELAVSDGTLKVNITAADPYLHSPPVKLDDRIVVTIRMKSSNGSGNGEIFWRPLDGEFGEGKSKWFTIKHDNQFHDYVVSLPRTGPVRNLRIDPGLGPAGAVEIDHIAIARERLHPLTIREVAVTDTEERVTVFNHANEPVPASFGTAARPLAPKSTMTFSKPRPASTAFAEKVDLTVLASVAGKQLPDAVRTIVVTNNAAKVRWVTITNKDVALDVAADGSGARIRRGGETVGIIAPLVWRPPELLKLDVARHGDSIRCTADSVSATFAFEDGAIAVGIQAKEPVEGPVLRAVGNLEQGLLAGVEHLGRGEKSSSELDLRGPRSNRFAPPPRHLTMPLMTAITERGSLTMLWTDTALRPTYASPNFYDGVDDHRMSLRGTTIKAHIRVGRGFPQDRLEDAVLWAVRKQGLPPLPKPLRSPQAQLALAQKAFTDSVIAGGDKGWYHAVVPGLRTMPKTPKHMGDLLSALLRTGAVTREAAAKLKIAPGGSHIRDDSVLLLTGQGERWLAHFNGHAAAMRKRQLPDGSYRYAGEMAEGHFEDTASGVCARPAFVMLQHARYTGNSDSLAAGIKTLEYMKRFRTPRGAQVWECPLHAPDVLASAYLVKSYVLGYELTGNMGYLKEAVRWALSGLPYVYQWHDREIMAYATTPTLCATKWRSPVWIGLPVQWCGLVYADALLDLLPHDQTLDWRQLADGIIIAAEQMLYPDGPSVGTLPDVFELDTQNRMPADINPANVIGLRRRLDGKPQGLYCAVAEGARVVAPFPVNLVNGKATIDGKGTYQILVNGTLRSVNGATTIPVK